VSYQSWLTVYTGGRWILHPVKMERKESMS
jgi:hypothetical protein